MANQYDVCPLPAVVFKTKLLCGFCESECRLLQETSEDLGKLLKSLASHSKELEPVQAAVVRDAQR